ncbi:hypothetical protein [Haloglomus litoreum]|uniref:hypothetical protein n=1 Tax=Haloglomus litoreum TaxID=3034026 RepID=UPI0023E8CDF6|nr:hypothetical protein [Haloglomus sp. DT116]
MSPTDVPRQREGVQGQPPIECDDCESALDATSRGSVSFLLLEQLAVPLVGCDAHLERFVDVCGFTSDETPDLLDHRPAGGVRCPSCQFAPHSPGHPVVPVQDGAVALLACPEHQSETIGRFHTGLETEQQLSASLDGLSQ